MPDLAPEAHQELADVAQRHGVSAEAALSVLRSLAAHGGTMAQFNHPELGGMGQWSAGGMVMVGDMFNEDLKRRVNALCSELAGQVHMLAAESPIRAAQTQSQGQGGHGVSAPGTRPAASGWWPVELGAPAASGAQNDYRYAYFPATRRLAVQRNGRLELYDTGDHRIFGVSQQQGGGGQSPVFSSDKGQVRLPDLAPVDHTRPSQARDAAAASAADGDPLASIERLAELHQKGVLTFEEFTAKKAELLRRL